VKITRPSWLKTLVTEDVLGAVVAVRIQHPNDPKRSAVVQRAYLDPDIPLRAVSGMTEVLQASADGVADLWNTTTEMETPASAPQLGDGKGVDTRERQAWTWEDDEASHEEECEPVCVAQRGDGRTIITGHSEGKGFTILLPEDKELIERVTLHLPVRGERAH
jgi:hypothetical protein